EQVPFFSHHGTAAAGFSEGAGKPAWERAPRRRSTAAIKRCFPLPYVRLATPFPPHTLRGHRCMSDLVQKFWGFCHTLRHDGIDYGDYIEQITYLLFLKMADERRIDLSHVGKTGKTGGAGGVGRATDCSWPHLSALAGPTLLEHYTAVLQALGRETGLL